MKKIICWFSGGVTSAVACKIAIDLYGKENCISLFIDTKNEDEDTYRFMKDCEKWFGISIDTLSAIPEKYKSIQEVWIKHLGLNFANGAICSSELKRAVRLKWQRENDYGFQVFGFDIDEPKRAKAMTLNYPTANAIYPLLLHGLNKEMCIEILKDAGIEIPRAYKWGFRNNNCLGTGCVQGGIGYWQHMKKVKPENFDAMAEMEHYLTDLKGQPVTMLKDQSKAAKASNNGKSQLVFLKPHRDYPNIKDISIMKGRPPKPLFECNGFGCAVNDLECTNQTQLEINYQEV